MERFKRRSWYSCSLEWIPLKSTFKARPEIESRFGMNKEVGQRGWDALMRWIRNVSTDQRLWERFIEEALMGHWKERAEGLVLIITQGYRRHGRGLRSANLGFCFCFCWGCLVGYISKMDCYHNIKNQYVICKYYYTVFDQSDEISLLKKLIAWRPLF